MSDEAPGYWFSLLQPEPPQEAAPTAEVPLIAGRRPIEFAWLAMRNAVRAHDRVAVLGVLWLAGEAGIRIEQSLLELTLA